VKMWEWKAV